MKIVLAFACLAALTMAFDLTHKDGLVHFEQDANMDSPIGFAMRGQIDPANEKNNKITTFLKLASHYIPILETMNEKKSNLEWGRTFNINLGGLGSVSVTGYFMVCSGWKVYLTENTFAQTTDHLEVAYAPYVWGWANAYLDGDAWLAKGFYNATLFFSRAYALISLQINDNGSVCFSGSGNFWPVTLESTMSVALLGGVDEILSNIIYGQPLGFTYNYTAPLNISHLNISFTQNYTQNIIDQKCINV
jgi:hypothetical protein